jgi:hypothetical protein
MGLMDQAALTKHPADVRFAGTSGSQARDVQAAITETGP